MMRKFLLLLCVSTFSFNCLAQVIFEKAIIIDNRNDTIKCLIKNADWYYNPVVIKYKLNESETEKEVNAKSIKEFSIVPNIKFISSPVMIDRASEQIEKMSKVDTPFFEPDTLFLKVLNTGKANLYFYNSSKIKKFFFSVNDGKIEQLIYKPFLNNYNQIEQNNTYKEQLLKNLPDLSFEQKSNLYKLDYSIEKLMEFFSIYNGKNSNIPKNIQSISSSKTKFNLNIRPRVNQSDLKIYQDILYPYSSDHGQKLHFGLGLEAEVVFPFNKSKWALAVEPTFQKYYSKKIFSTDFFNENTYEIVDYKTIEVPINIRHYLFLKNKSKFFMDGGLIYNLPINSTYKLIDVDNREKINNKINSKLNFTLGIGYKLKDKFSIQFRRSFNRNLLEYRNLSTTFNTNSIILGYTIL